MMKHTPKVYVLRGIPGSGKTWYAHNRLRASLDVPIVSANDFMMMDGEYRYSPSRLTAAHGHCMRKFVQALARDMDIIVDNTNIEAVDIAPYVALADAYKYDHSIITLDTPIDVALARQLHGVPEKKVERLYERVEHTHKHFPHRWHHVILTPGDSGEYVETFRYTPEFEVDRRW